MDRERREFLRQLSALSAAIAAAPALSACRARGSAEPPRAFAPDQRRVLDALLEHILPTDDEPGAREAGCADFVDLELAKQEFGLLKTVLERGLQALESEARAVGGDGFAQLSSEQRDQVLREVEQLRARGFSGQRFVHLAIVLTLEGFLCDPRHGGNRDGIGWRVIGHRPVRWAPDDGRGWRGTP